MLIPRFYNFYYIFWRSYVCILLCSLLVLLLVVIVIDCFVIVDLFSYK